jgi:hypothetical protein
MPKSLREVAAEMDRLADPGAGSQLSALLNQHRWPPAMPSASRGLQEIVRRHEDCDRIKFLSYNTFLTQALIRLPDPFPDLRIAPKPALHERAHEIGRQLRLDYDFVSLYEVMQLQQRDEVLSNWDPVLPDNFYGGSLSSLFTISPKFRIGRREQRTYEHKGKSISVSVPVVGPTIHVSLDSDFYANKGVMLTEILTPHGIIEVFSTHLFFGGGLGDAAGLLVNALTPFGKHVSESTPEERFNTQMAELAELVDFVTAQHKQENVAIICGDFNIDGADPAKFASLKARLAGFTDVWAEGGFPNDLQGGYTTRNDDGAGPIQLDFKPVCTELPGSDEYCDDSSKPATQIEFDGIGRYDYIFVQDPQPSHTAMLDLTRVRRRQFHHVAQTGDQNFLSDHIGLETTLIVSQNLH